MTNRTEIANKIAEALSGHHTERGTYGHALLNAKVWSKNGRVRVYIDRRHVGTDGTIDTRVQGNGFIEILPAGEIVHDLRIGGHEIRRLVEAL